MKTMIDYSRRNFLKTGTILAMGGLMAPAFGREKNFHADNLSDEDAGKPFELPPLPYTYEALEPFIDRQTMELHYSKHHAAYVDNLNKALLESNKPTVSIEALIAKISRYPKVVRNNAGGHFNHSMFWKSMKPNGGGMPTGALAEAISGSFGSFELFKSQFNETATKHFGSGWTWLVKRKNKLEIGTTDNQDNPLMDISDFKGSPILGLDVWEHAYYLKYQNRRVEYINAWWNLVSWDEASRNFSNAR